MFTFLFTSRKRTLHTGIYIWPESGQPLWRAKVLCSTGWGQRKRNSESSKTIWIREDDKKQNILLLSFCLQTVNLPQHYRKSQRVPPEITWVAGLLHNCLRSCFLLRGYYHLNVETKNHGDQGLTDDSIWSWCRKNEETMPSITNPCAHTSSSNGLKTYNFIQILYLMWFTFPYSHEINL